MPLWVEITLIIVALAVACLGLGFIAALLTDAPDRDEVMRARKGREARARQLERQRREQEQEGRDA